MQADEERRRAALHEQWRRLEALGRLSGAVAHDFNNVLQVIQSVAELLRHRLPPDRADLAALIGMLERNTRHGASLTRKMVAFSGKSALEPSSVNSNALVAGLLPRVRELVGPGVLAMTQLQPGVPPVYVDAEALETALLNLATNSRDALRAGGELRIETRIAQAEEVALAVAIDVPPTRYVAITVSDTGSGMAPEVAQRAFDPYFTTKDTAQGVGLGLAQVYGFVQQSGGYVMLDTSPGRGTRVTLYLPPLAERAAEADAASKDANAKAQPARLRVLLVEDESLIAMLVEDLLGQLGCTLAGVVLSIDKALEAIERGGIDLALLDVDLGGEPVYPVAKALAARGVPFLFMSGYGGLEAAWRESPIVHKPFDLAALKDGIARALARRGGA
jgi:nitrogen-specific signal transduction histidine kinase/CheY-like chemotaxis protein